MKMINSKIMVLTMACLFFAGCGESNEEKVLAQARDGGDWVKQKRPDCELRDPITKKYANGKGCTWDELKEFEKNRSW